jgi:hypothetical protein
MRPPAIPLPRREREYERLIFTNGITFHEVAVRCDQPIDDGDGLICDALHAKITSYAFACELYLKSLILISTGVRSRGHRLSELMLELPAEVRIRVQGDLSHRLGWSFADTEDQIEQLSPAFVDWRYVHERAVGSFIHVPTLFHLTQTLYQTIRALKPEWDVVDKQHDRLCAAPTEPVIWVIVAGGGQIVEILGRP